ncbi:MAG: acylneuraminate cytidylyltransferase family protein [Chloroflexi bacterium]|jgi:CMP-N-acetylneuraminic acid synthetase|nr:acylneuraminate cytidylyltransferase family protein [Chloroflexota bacterium]MBT3670050.1 acylneuraminate cytidylyltransferase family protein [Chloroflexota bacterium]MBT4002201.1 acylneuraminate cytidylyltransferase family protein [Chloroflexota bacterium]MBT4306748.1 acylneuraminate cytidylyltransferase family protein [Chloroflexota bacterium]MBT4532936.1 acylneuraminate cytidylyltransferase family protein [Chloroflexota bacterium]
MTNIKKEVLAIIPARGGSKGIPRKNVIDFAGYPLISYSIAAGLASEHINRVIVSTDNEEIAEVSRRYGAETPFMRPSIHAQDLTPDLPVFSHALEWLAENEDYHPDIVVQLRPTSPFRRLWHIEKAVEKLIEEPEADAVRTVIEPFQNPYKMWQIGKNGFLQPIVESLYKEPYNMPRQALPDVFWQTGYVDVVWVKTILEKKSMTGDRILPLQIDSEDWVDIDSLDDWRRAERLISSGEISLNDLGFQISEV